MTRPYSLPFCLSELLSKHCVHCCSQPAEKWIYVPMVRSISYSLSTERICVHNLCPQIADKTKLMVNEKARDAVRWEVERCVCTW